MVLGDMSKPIYRYLAERKWQEYPRKVQVQRINQMDVIPDVVPMVDPILDIKVAFGKRTFPPGDYVPSLASEQPPRLTLQSFEKGEKVVTVAVVDPDVPNIEADSFDSRCHFLASNITISPTQAAVDFASLARDSQVLLPWLPPHAQKGSPYHRLSIVVLQQKDNIPIDVGAAAKMVQRDGFTVRSFMSRHLLKPISASLFRTTWDENTAAVMAKAGLEGGDIELKRKKVEPLPYKRRNPSSFR
jgi:large subunit ribosomal protein L35